MGEPTALGERCTERVMCSPVKTKTGMISSAHIINSTTLTVSVNARRTLLQSAFEITNNVKRHSPHNCFKLTVTKIDLAQIGPFGLTSCQMTDKQTPLILAALARAAAEPGGVPPVSTKQEKGLFPNTAPGRAAAKRCLEDQMIQTINTEKTGQTSEFCTITERGLRHLTDHVSPRKLLEDFVRVLEERNEQVQDLLSTAQRMARSIEGMKTTVGSILPQVLSARVSVPAQRRFDTPELDLQSTLLTHLRDWRSDTANDCPLPELYRAVACGNSNCTIGQFHDTLRLLHDSGKVYLHPWTGPLYTLPEPSYALVIGHNIAYYASLRTQ